jgi:uncharacterized protein YecE (DUF72 family)
MILLGTSGYSFRDWIGPFYPPGIEPRQMLDFYVREFSTVEVNSTYYRIPHPATFHAMAKKTPPGFEFVVKAHHDHTHKRLPDAELDAAFQRAMEPLLEVGKLSGVLAQFPNSYRLSGPNVRYLEELKERLPDVPLFVEFRHESWVDEELFPELESRGLGYVSVDEPDLPGLLPPIARATGDIAYVRFHGRNKVNWYRDEGGWPPDSRTRSRGARAGASRAPTAPAPATPEHAKSLGPLFSGVPMEPPKERPLPAGTRQLLRYDYMYSESELKEWVGKIRELAANTKKTFVFFNNCHAGQAATSAKLMRRMLEGEGIL